MTPTGTLHYVEATKREQLGSHKVELEIKSDTVPVAASKTVTFEIDILDCKVSSYQAGTQVFKSVEVKVGEQAIFQLNEFTMEPACGFTSNYTVTLVAKPFGSTNDVSFPVEQEGW